MKITLSNQQAAEMLYTDPHGGFSYDGAHALVEFLDELDPDTELDCVAIRCDFGEWKSLQDWREDYFCKGKAPIDDSDESIREFIHDHGMLIEFPGGVIVSCF